MRLTPTDSTLPVQADPFAPCRGCYRFAAPDSSPHHCHGPVLLAGLPVCPITEVQCVEVVIRGLKEGRGGWIVTVNLDHLRRGTRDPRYAAAMLEADYRVADGMPLVWSSRLQRTPLPERVAGSNLIGSLCRALGEHGRSAYLLGGNPDTAKASARLLQQSYPGLHIAGTACPAIDFERDAAQTDALRNDLVSTRPDLVFVALGSPKQEYFIQEVRPLLPQTWWLGVGISFSFLCGEVKRAPRRMQELGLEWVHRLAQEPGRLARRYLTQGIPFAARLLTDAVRNAGRNGNGAPHALGHGLDRIHHGDASRETRSTALGSASDRSSAPH